MPLVFREKQLQRSCLIYPALELGLSSTPLGPASRARQPNGRLVKAILKQGDKGKAERLRVFLEKVFR